MGVRIAGLGLCLPYLAAWSMVRWSPVYDTGPVFQAPWSILLVFALAASRLALVLAGPALLILALSRTWRSTR